MPPTRYLPPLLRQFAAAALAALIGLPAGAAPVALPATPDAWRLAAETDIDAAAQITRENHPGARDPYNPGFLPNLEAARRHGLALAARVKDGAGYAAAVEGFNVRIGDGHAGMRVLIDESVLPAPRWPGFVSVWRGDGLYVYAAEPGQPPVGSKLLGCDGKDARRLILDNVFSFKGRVAEAGQWWSVARLLFVDAGNPFVEVPQRCRFESNGQIMERALAWHELDDTGLTWLKESRDGDGDAGQVGMTEPRENLYWVSMPTFHPNEEERAAYKAMNRDIETRRARYLAADAIVVDLRRNSGGSSSWSLEFAKTLWGKERVVQARAAYSSKTEVWWRASKGNTEYVASLAQRLGKQGDTAGAAWVRTQAEGMRNALARGEPFHLERKSTTPASGDAAAGAPFTRPLYVVVPGNCASACLDAIDTFTRFPNTTLVGAPSSADSTYMEVRSQALASGLAAVIVPNKVYVRRARANGQVYTPRLELRDLAWSTRNLLNAVERDLARP